MYNPNYCKKKVFSVDPTRLRLNGRPYGLSSSHQDFTTYTILPRLILTQGTSFLDVRTDVLTRYKREGREDVTRSVHGNG